MLYLEKKKKLSYLFYMDFFGRQNKWFIHCMGDSTLIQVTTWVTRT